MELISAQAVIIDVPESLFKGDPKSKYKLGLIYAFEGVDFQFHISFLSFDL